MLTTKTRPYHSLRDAITKAYRMDEALSLNHLISKINFTQDAEKRISALAGELVRVARQYKKTQGIIDKLLIEYDLSSEEGIALMCLAEALLRIPDKATMDKLISDKLSHATWKDHLNQDQAFFVNAATWSLLLTGKIYAPTLQHQKNLFSALKRAGSRLGAFVLRPIILQMMKAIGNQFIIGETIDEALKNGEALQKMNYRLSYDMLGEAARTEEDAANYIAAYVKAIDAIGQNAKALHPAQNPGISVKLSALHPRYDYSQYDRLIEEIPPILLSLATQAKKYNIGLTVDAEEADRLDLSLDIFAKVLSDPALAHWEGLGLALQAYQKRAYYVIEWLDDLAKTHGKRIMVRLVKGAYWDQEIKLSQIQGQKDYPVFTRKHGTDVSYLACANKLLAAPQSFYAQFGTHNAYCVAAILEMADKENNQDFEFQCLYGMGRALYDQIIDPLKHHHPCRMYAPVGTHINLLGYLVRRLLENGANSSFLNHLAHEKIPIEKVIQNPVLSIAKREEKSHPKIPKPRNIYGAWQNAKGLDLSDYSQLIGLKKEMDDAIKTPWVSASIVNGESLLNRASHPIVSPSDRQYVVGTAFLAHDEDILLALKTAEHATKAWGSTSPFDRAKILEKAADIFEEKMPYLIAMLAREGGKCIADGIAEVREAIDYCRYYAYRARVDLAPVLLPGPTGEENILSLHPRGIIACISPWNFPLAIFSGQVLAALASGNPVIAKPAEQTPLIAYAAIQLLHEAGIPRDALQLLIGPGREVGAKLVSDPRVSGVIFTGSTETAKSIALSLAKRKGPIPLLIAETGGQNAMIIDSSALAEQAVIDIAQSAFNSAGQRCSACRVLFVQEDIAPKLLRMLKGYMQELVIGDPSLYSTDIGPVIDAEAENQLKKHFAALSKQGTLIAEVPLSSETAGNYFAPCAFEINDLSILKGEVFGPILHVIRYQADRLHSVMEAIIHTHYGLTLGIHSRIDATIQFIAKQMPVGNIYVNRNMIGAVVGVQPFGGERLSGTGPKAGGPHYLPRLCVERCVSTNTTALGGNARLVSLLEENE